MVLEEWDDMVGEDWEAPGKFLKIMFFFINLFLIIIKNRGHLFKPIRLA